MENINSVLNWLHGEKNQFIFHGEDKATIVAFNFSWYHRDYVGEN